MHIQTQLQQIPNIHEWDSMQSAGKIIVILKYKWKRLIRNWPELN